MNNQQQPENFYKGYRQKQKLFYKEMTPDDIGNDSKRQGNDIKEKIA